MPDPPILACSSVYDVDKKYPGTFFVPVKCYKFVVMKTRRRIKAIFDDRYGKYRYLLQRHVNYGWLEFFGCKGWWVTDADTISVVMRDRWADHYNIHESG